MYCTNCGNNLGVNDKFCSSCGNKITQKQSPDLSNSPIGKLNLLAGAEDWAEGLLDRQPEGKPYIALNELIKEYPSRLKNDGKLLKFIKRDTLRYILDSEFINHINTEINSEKLKRMSAKEREEVFSVLNIIRQDLILIGYLLRMFSSHENKHAKFEELKGLSSPSQVVPKLSKYVGQPKDMFTDEGFAFPYGASMTFWNKDEGLINVIRRNIEKMDEKARVFLIPDDGNIVGLMCVGWCLARFDWARKLDKI